MKIITYYQKATIIAKNKLQYSLEKPEQLLDITEELKMPEASELSEFIIKTAKDIKEANEKAEQLKLAMNPIGSEVILKVKKLIS